MSVREISDLEGQRIRCSSRSSRSLPFFPSARIRVICGQNASPLPGQTCYRSIIIAIVDPYRSCSRRSSTHLIALGAQELRDLRVHAEGTGKEGLGADDLGTEAAEVPIEKTLRGVDRREQAPYRLYQAARDYVGGSTFLGVRSRKAR